MSDTHRSLSMAKKLKLKPKEEAQDERLRARPLGPHFLKKWRKAKDVSQIALAQEIGCSTGTISQIENLNTGYSQQYVEAVADQLGVHPCDLIARDPDDAEGIWSLWQAASASQRKQIVSLARVILESST